MHTRLAIVGVLVGATVTVLATSVVPSSATEPGPQPEVVGTPLAAAHGVAARHRAMLLRQRAWDRLQEAAAKQRAERRAALARVHRQERQQRWVVPVAGATLSAGFGESGSLWESGQHTGQDFVVPYGTTVRAAHGGTVTFAGWGDRYGDLVEITHPGGVESWYAHLSSVSVAVGDRLRTGAVVGTTGCSGNCIGTHLHFEVHLGHDVAVDPLEWLRLRRVHR